MTLVRDPLHGRPGRLPRWASVAVGVALVVVGVVLALRPFRSLAVLLMLLVVALALAGVGDLLRGRRPWGPLRGIGQLGLALGLLLWSGPGLGLLTLAVVPMCCSASPRSSSAWSSCCDGTWPSWWWRSPSACGWSSSACSC